MTKQIECTKSDASLLWFSITVATNSQKVILVGPERQRHAMAALKPLRVLLGDDRPNKTAEWKFRYKVKDVAGEDLDDAETYTLTFDDEAFRMLKEYWDSPALNRGIFLMDEDSCEHLLGVDALMAAAKEAPVEVKPTKKPDPPTPAAPSVALEAPVKRNGKTKAAAAA